MEREVVVVYLFMMMQMMILQHQQRKNRRRRLVPPVPPIRQRYRPRIPYNSLNRFTFVDMNSVLCHSLTRFYPGEIQRFLPLLALHEIRFRARCTATPEEALAVVLIRLFKLMGRFVGNILLEKLRRNYLLRVCFYEVFGT